MGKHHYSSITEVEHRQSSEEGSQPQHTGGETVAWNRDGTCSLSPKCPRWRSPPARASWLYARSAKEGEGSVTGWEAEPNLSPVIMFNIDFCIPLPLAWQDFATCRANGSCSHNLLAAGLSCIRPSPPSRPVSEPQTCLRGLRSRKSLQIKDVLEGWRHPEFRVSLAGSRPRRVLCCGRAPCEAASRIPALRAGSSPAVVAEEPRKHRIRLLPPLSPWLPLPVRRARTNRKIKPTAKSGAGAAIPHHDSLSARKEPDGGVPRHPCAAPVSDPEMGTGLGGARCNARVPNCPVNVGFGLQPQNPGEGPCQPQPPAWSIPGHGAGSFQPSAPQTCQHPRAGLGWLRAGLTPLLPHLSNGGGKWRGGTSLRPLGSPTPPAP